MYKSCRRFSACVCTIYERRGFYMTTSSKRAACFPFSIVAAKASDKTSRWRDICRRVACMKKSRLGATFLFNVRIADASYLRSKCITAQATSLAVKQQTSRSLSKDGCLFYSTIRPTRLKVLLSVISTLTICPVTDKGASKFTSLCSGVRPDCKAEPS